MGLRDSQFVTVFLPAFRALRDTRRPPSGVRETFRVQSTGGVDLFCSLAGENPGACVVVAHSAIGGSFHPQVRVLAGELAASFSVLTFDFRGHGKSTGRCRIGFQGPSEDLEAVAAKARGMGFSRLGLAGFSMGAAAGFLLEARSPSFDAFVSIGCPPSMPDLVPGPGRKALTRAALRVLGMRAEFMADGGPSPADVAPHLPAIPKLLVFGEWETSPAEEVDAFAASVTPPSEKVVIPGAWHADLAGREPMVRDWLETHLGSSHPG